MLKVGIIGATGYAGAELFRLLRNHKKVEIIGVASHSFSGKRIDDVYSGFKSNFEFICKNLEDFVHIDLDKCDVVFAALPHGLSEKIAQKCDTAGNVFIDLGADFRLDDEEEYLSWYGLEYANKELHSKSQYGLTEIYRDKIRKSRLIGNPGCYPTSIILGLRPALENNIIDEKTIIIDSKSGLTGAGRELSLASHYAECNESISAYKIGCHRHVPEIEQELSKAAGKNVTVTFTPHLLPINRGILSTIYSSMTSCIDLDELIELYVNYYKNDPFIRIMNKNQKAEIKNVRGSNYCNIELNIDKRTNRLIIVSVIDNMVKGAAGQAIQNMNVIFGLEEHTGLEQLPMIF